MKHLIKIYTIYFTLLMIVPCNHSVLYASLAKNVFQIESHHHCNNEEHHHDATHTHHHSCTPFCACGAAHFIIAPPLFKAGLASTTIVSYRLFPTLDAAWSTKTNIYRSDSVNDIWNPPQLG